jgi:Domain of unknown function (DUF4388)
VSLEGTLETIALPDVLALLSVTAKSGELRVESGGGVGRVWLDAGRVSGFDVGSQRSAVDAFFALLRLKDGNFKFHAGTEPLNPVEPQEVAPLMEEAEERLVQWPAISAVVPSLSSKVNLEDSVDADVNLSPEQWGLVAQIGGGRSVGEVLDARNFGEFDGCKAVKELVDLGLVKVDHLEVATDALVLSPAPATQDLAPPVEDDVPPAPEFPEQSIAPSGWSESELSSLSEVWNDETGQVETAPIETAPVGASPAEASVVDDAQLEEGPVEAGHPVNRGLLLKFLGSARS